MHSSFLLPATFRMLTVRTGLSCTVDLLGNTARLNLDGRFSLCIAA